MADKIYIELSLKQKQALDGLDKLNSKFKNIETSLTKTTSLTKIFAGNLAATGAAKAIGFLTSQLKQSFDVAVSFDKALKEIQTILPKQAKNVDNLKFSLRELSKEFGSDPQKQAKAFYQIVSAGITDATEAAYLLRKANMLSLGGIAELGDSINILTDIRNIYGDVEGAADSLFQTVKLGKTTISELSTSMGQVLPSAQRLNVSLDEVGAALATLTTQGLSTSERVTQLDGLFTAIFRKQDTAKQFGTAVQKAFSVEALRKKGLPKFLDDLIKATNGSEQVLVKLLGRMEGVKAVFGLTGKGAESFTKNIVEMGNKSGAASEAAEKLKDSLDFRIKESIAQIQDLALTIFDQLAPSLITGLKAFNKFAGIVSKGKLGESIADEEQLELITRLNHKIAQYERRIQGTKETIQELKKGSWKNWFINLDKQKSNLDKYQKQLEIFLNQRDVLLQDAGKMASLEDVNKFWMPEVKSKTAPIPVPDGGTNGGGGLDTARIQQEQETQKKIIALRKETALATRELELIRLSEQGDLNDQKFETLVEQLGLENAAKLQALEDLNAGTLEKQLAREDIEKKIADKKLKEELKRIDDKKKAEDEYLKYKENAFKNSANVLDRIAIKTTKGDKQQLDKRRQAANDTWNAMQTLAENGSKTAFAIVRAGNIAQATINGYLAITNAMANIPMPYGAVAAGVIGAAAAVQVAKIASSKPPSYEQGGIIPGKPSPRDNTIANVASGEAVLTMEDQKSMFDMLRNGLNQAAQTIVVEIDGMAVATAGRNARLNGATI